MVAETTTKTGDEILWLESNASGPCAGEHCWTWSGDLPSWPYDGMPCDCGAERYDKAQDIKERIARLQAELRELEAVAVGGMQNEHIDQVVLG